MLHVWECTSLTLLSKVLSRTKPKSWSLTKLRSFFPALMMVTMTSWRMASSGSWERTFRYSEWIMRRKKMFNPHLWSDDHVEERTELEESETDTGAETLKHKQRVHLSGLWPGLGGSWGSGWQTLHTLAWLERGCHWTWRKTWWKSLNNASY